MERAPLDGSTSRVGELRVQPAGQGEGSQQGAGRERCGSPACLAGTAARAFPISPLLRSLFRNLEEVEKLSELGVLFLLFEMGLELSIDRLRVRRAAGEAAEEQLLLHCCCSSAAAAAAAAAVAAL